VRQLLSRYGPEWEMEPLRHGTWTSLHALQAGHAYIVYGQPASTLERWRNDIVYPSNGGVVLSGSEANGVPQLSAAANAALREVLFKDVCPTLAGTQPHSATDTPVTLDECRTFDGGVLQAGLHGGVTRFMALAAAAIDEAERLVVPVSSRNGTGVLYQRPPAALESRDDFNISSPVWANATAVPASIPAALQSRDMALLRAHAVRFVGPITLRLTDTYHQASLHVVSQYRTFAIVFIAVGAGLISASIAALFLPAIRRLDRDVHHKRALLLLLPPQAMAYVPSLKAFVEDILAQSSATSGGSTSGGSSRGGSRGHRSMAGSTAPGPRGSVAGDGGGDAHDADVDRT